MRADYTTATFDYADLVNEEMLGALCRSPAIPGVAR